MKTLITLLILILPFTPLISQTDTLFWFAAPDISSIHGTAPQNGTPLYFHITAESHTTVTISQPANINFTPVVISMSENESRQIRLTDLLDIDQIENYPDALPQNPSGTQKKAFRITAEPGNISVYYDADNNYNKELFTLKGRNAMGRDFIVSTQNYFPNGTYSNTAWSGFIIAATENNTRIVVYPNDDWYLFETNPGDSIVLNLNAGETFAFRAASTDADRHINGVPVKSNKDIVITIYDDSIRKKNQSNTTCASSLSYDIIGDQLIPILRTGKEYIVIKDNVTNVVTPNCPADGGERIFITSTESNTDIQVDGQYVQTLPLAGQVISYPVDSAVVHVLASKPVYIHHISGMGGELGSAILPSVDVSAGSKKMAFTRSPNQNDVIRLNVTAKNEKNVYGNSTIDAFTITSANIQTSVPATFFDYLSDSAWIVLQKTLEVQAFFNDKILPGQTVIIENTVSNFQLGIIGGGQMSGCKYGYLSDFGPKPQKEIIQSKDSLQVIISSGIFENESVDEWLVLKITDTVTNKTWYDTSATVSKAFGFHDTVYVDSGVYKCEIIDMGANVEMPVIKVNNHIIPWGYPEYEYYLFTVPGVYNTEKTLLLSSCDSLVSPSGKYTWYTGGTWFDTIPNAEGYDSLLTVNLDLKYSTSAELNDTACFSYVSPGGTVFESSGIYREVITNAAGCDSSISINLTIKNVDNTVETISTTLKAMEEGATYQWLSCASGLDIAGATEQLYTPVVTGLYAVRITKDGCTVTSYCNPITGVDQYGETEPEYYPNPVKDRLTIELKELYNNIELQIEDMSGRSVLVKSFTRQDVLQIETGDLLKGIYFVRIAADGKDISFKIIK